MAQTAASVRPIAGAPVALKDHPRAERPGLDQVQRDVFGDRRQERRAATDDNLRAWFPLSLPHDQRALRRAPPQVRERPDAVRRRPQQRRRGGAPGRARGRANRPGIGGTQGPPSRLSRVRSRLLAAVSPVVSVVSSGDETSRTEFIHPRATLINALGRHARGDLSVVFITEMVAFFRDGRPGHPERPAEARQGPGTTVLRVPANRLRVDPGQHRRRLLVFSDTGKRDVKEAYAYDIPPAGEPRPSSLRRA
jgi:hypothetical protein